MPEGAGCGRPVSLRWIFTSTYCFYSKHIDTHTRIERETGKKRQSTSQHDGHLSLTGIEIHLVKLVPCWLIKCLPLTFEINKNDWPWALFMTNRFCWFILNRWHFRPSCRLATCHSSFPMSNAEIANLLDQLVPASQSKLLKSVWSIFPKNSFVSFYQGINLMTKTRGKPRRQKIGQPRTTTFSIWSSSSSSAITSKLLVAQL